MSAAVRPAAQVNMNHDPEQVFFYLFVIFILCYLFLSIGHFAAAWFSAPSVVHVRLEHHTTSQRRRPVPCARQLQAPAALLVAVMRHVRAWPATRGRASRAPPLTDILFTCLSRQAFTAVLLPIFFVFGGLFLPYPDIPIYWKWRAMICDARPSH